MSKIAVKQEKCLGFAEQKETSRLIKVARQVGIEPYLVPIEEKWFWYVNITKEEFNKFHSALAKGVSE